MNCSSRYWSCDDMMYVPPQVNTALELLSAAGYEAYLVGGAVRDYVRENRQGHDWDITTSALPEEVERVFAGFRLIETGLKHGTVTVVIEGEPLEITTYRVDGIYSDHRRPDTVSFTRSLREDVERRDFASSGDRGTHHTGFCLRRYRQQWRHDASGWSAAPYNSVPASLVRSKKGRGSRGRICFPEQFQL